MSNIIIVFADPETRKVELYFPIPKDGILEIIKSNYPGPAIIPLNKANEEQKAFYWFWFNGTMDRVNNIIMNGRGAGVRQTLKWLLNMRITESFKKSGFLYKLEIISNVEKWKEISNHISEKTHQLMATT